MKALRNHSISPPHIPTEGSQHCYRHFAGCKLRITLEQDQKYNRSADSPTLPGVQSRGTGLCWLSPGAGGSVQQPWVPARALQKGWSKSGWSMSAEKLPSPARSCRQRGRNCTKLFSWLAMRAQQFLTASMCLILLKHVVL